MRSTIDRPYCFDFPTKLNKYSLTGTDSGNTCLGLGDWNQEGQRMSVTLVDHSMNKPYTAKIPFDPCPNLLETFYECKIFSFQ